MVFSRVIVCLLIAWNYFSRISSGFYIYIFSFDISFVVFYYSSDKNFEVFGVLLFFLLTVKFLILL